MFGGNNSISSSSNSKVTSRLSFQRPHMKRARRVSASMGDAMVDEDKDDGW